MRIAGIMVAALVRWRALHRKVIPKAVCFWILVEEHSASRLPRCIWLARECSLFRCPRPSRNLRVNGVLSSALFFDRLEDGLEDRVWRGDNLGADGFAFLVFVRDHRLNGAAVVHETL